MTSFKFDFGKGDFELIDCRVTKISDCELVANKIDKLLRTEFDKYPIYSEYGMKYHSWIYTVRDRELISLALSRELSERIPRLTADVKRIYDISFEFERRGVKTSFSVETSFGDIREEGIWIAF